MINNSKPSNSFNSSPADSTAEPLLMRNLLNDLEGLASYFRQELDRGALMNAFLLAAGINQVVEDYLHQDVLLLHRAALMIAQDAPSFIKPFSRITHAVAFITNFIFIAQPHVQRLRRWQVAWAKLVQDLAGQALIKVPTFAQKTSRIKSNSAELLTALEKFPAKVLRLVQRIPSCFRGFDQVPDDFNNLVQKFSTRWPDRDRLLVVVGIRTSGSYIAPLCCEFLRQSGYSNVTAITSRPSSYFLHSEMEFIHSAVRENALFLIVDDPPVSGQTYLQSAQELQRAGIPPENIVLLIALFSGHDGFPKLLKPFNAVVLPWEEWTIHRRLELGAVQAALSEFLEPKTHVVSIERASSMPCTVKRSHMCALYQITLKDLETGKTRQQKIFVKGVGFAYFGEHSLAVTHEMTANIPPIYSLRDGLLFRQWLAEEDRLPYHMDGRGQDTAKGIVDYIVTRHLKLAVPQDLSVRLLIEGSAWEVASRLVSSVFGRAWWAARIPLVDPLIKRILHTSDPSIIDGNMSPSNWFLNRRENHPIKIAFDEGVFRNDVEFTCYDPVFDLASLATDLELEQIRGASWVGELFASLRPFYQSATGEKITEERWLIYQLVRLWDVQRDPAVVPENTVWRAFSRVLQRYYSTVFFRDIHRLSSGPICALDLDGVLETNYLGFGALSPTSAMALRALMLHGYRPVLATGRSLPELKDRCSAYPLAGGVVEYGSVIFNPSTGNTRILLSEDDQRVIADLRGILRAMPDIQVDPDYCFSVRAYRFASSGQRTRLKPTDIAAALQLLDKPELIRTIPGEEQTDFIAASIDKGSGLRALLAELQPERQPNQASPLVMAVGDTPSDLSMLNMAGLSCVPAHAKIESDHTAIKRMPKPYQAGFAMAVSRLIGHPPGSCPLCSAPNLDQDASNLLALFSAQETGLSSMLKSALHLVHARADGNLRT